MNGSDLGRAVAGQIMMLIMAGVVGGAVAALCAYFGVGWLILHLRFS